MFDNLLIQIINFLIIYKIALTTCEITNSLNLCFVQLPSIMSTAIIPRSVNAGKRVYLLPQIKTTFFNAHEFTLE